MALTSAGMAQPRDTSVEELLRHSSWVRNLARSLTSDPHRADDLTQDTWLAALQHRPASAGNLRGWLGRVMGNLLRQERRGESRRRAREQAFAEGEQVEESAASALERLSVHGELVTLVSELDEPFRNTIILRYFDELSLQEIARRCDTSVSTVGSRLSRGIARLRETLERRSTERTDWLRAVATLALGKGAPTPSSTTVTLLTMSLKTNLILAGSALAGVIGLFYILERTSAGPQGGGNPGTETQTTSLRTATSTPVLTGTLELPRERVRLDSKPLAQPPLDSPALAPLSEDDGLLHGRVIDLDSQPVAFVDVAVVGRDDAFRVSSDSDGRFTLEPPTTRVEITPDEEGWAHVFAAVWEPGSRLEAVLVVAPSVSVSGSVLDQDRNPLSTAYLRYQQADGIRTRFSEILDSSDAHDHETRADAEGRFELGSVPLVEGATLLVACEGFESQALTIEEFLQPPVEVVLLRPQLAEALLTGEVIDADGQPVGGAHVALGWSSTRTDENGFFSLDASAAGLEERVLALASGHQPGRVDEPPAPEAELPWQGYVVVQLGPEPLTITGIVLDANGSPLADARVWPTDATFFGMLEGRGVRAEGILAGRPVQADDDPDYSQLSTATFPWVRTDEHGRFELVGMLEREYTLRAFEVDTLSLTELSGIHGGQRGVELRLDAAGAHPRVAGIVRDHQGNPLPAVRITAHCDADVIPWGPHGRVSWRQAGASVMSDTAGRFTMPALPRRHITLSFEGDAIVPLQLPLQLLVEQAPAHNAAELRVELHLRYHVQVVLTGERRGWVEHVRVLDEDGRPMEVRVIGAGGYSSSDQAPVHDGRSNMLSVAEGATSVSLVGAGGRAELVPIAFDARRVFIVSE